MDKKILNKYDLTKKTTPYQFGGKKYLELEKKMLGGNFEVEIEIPDGARTVTRYNSLETHLRNTEISFSKSNKDVDTGVVWSNTYTIPVTSEKLNEFTVVCCNGERIPMMDLTRESTLRMFNTDILPKGSIVKFTYSDTRFEDEHCMSTHFDDDEKDDEYYIKIVDQIGFVRTVSVHCIEIMYKYGNEIKKVSVTPGDLFDGEYEDKDSRVELNIEILDIESMLKENEE